MSVASSAVMSGGNGAGGLDQTVSASTAISTAGLTVNSGDKLLTVPILWQNTASADITNRAATWNSSSMIEACSVSSASGTDVIRVSWFYQINPASGNNTLRVSWSNVADAYMGGMSWIGTDTVNGIKAADSVTATQTSTIQVTCSPGDASAAVFGVNGLIPTMNFNKIFADDPLNPGGGANFTTGSASNIHTFTGSGGSAQALAGIHILQVQGTIPSSGAYQQEQNSTDRYQLEDGSGVYLIEPWPPAGGGFVPPRTWGDIDGLGRWAFRDRLNG